MSIKRNPDSRKFGKYDLICDICGEKAEEDFTEFDAAVAYKKDKSNGWRSRKEDGEWYDVCPTCVNDGN